ncbi:MAG TPA: helix-turn-helix transcriptional regulator [Pirellulales bacterium]|nr:helix-turn-helix transcriptional regulator [Pirellulales bacterium]
MKLHKDLVAASAAPLVLSILSGGESYGYRIIQRVRDLSRGEIQWTDGMLYPVLHRLETQGFVRSRWVTTEATRKRKYYTLTAAGKRAHGKQKEQWQVVHATLTKSWSGLCPT